MEELLRFMGEDLFQWAGRILFLGAYAGFLFSFLMLTIFDEARGKNGPADKRVARRARSMSFWALIVGLVSSLCLILAYGVFNVEIK